MAEQIIIQLEFDKNTGKKNILIKYDSDDDQLPWEHESRHKEIVEQLIWEGVIDEDDVGQIVVGRVEGVSTESSTSQQEQTPEPQKQSAGEG